MLVTIVASIACFIVGGILSYVLFKYGLKAKYDNVLKEAETEAVSYTHLTLPTIA